MLQGFGWARAEGLGERRLGLCVQGFSVVWDRHGV